MSESPRILELREQLAELGAPEPGTGDVAEATRASILAELVDLGAAPEPPKAEPRNLPACHAIRLSSLRPRPVPTPAIQEPAPPDADLTPAVLVATVMAKPHPLARLQELLDLHAQHHTAGNPGAAGLTRMRIRRHCEFNGLPIPEVAIKRPTTTPYKDRKKPAPKTHEAWQRGLSAFMRYGPPSAAARLRALRSQAIEVLELLEDLNPAEAQAARDELTTLTKVLTLSGELIARRIA